MNLNQTLKTKSVSRDVSEIVTKSKILISTTCEVIEN